MDQTAFSRRGFLRAAMIMGGSAATAGVLTACGNAETSEETASPSSSQPAVRTVTDDHGRQVEVPGTITAISVIGFGARAVVYAGATERLVGVSDRDKGEVSAALPFAMANLEFLDTLPSVCSGGAQDTVYEEQMLSLKPDVIISTATDVAVNDELQAKLGIPVVYVGMNNFGIFQQDFYDSLTMLGEIFDTSSWTDTMIAAMRGWHDDLQQRTGSIPETERVRVFTGGVSFRGPHGIEGTYGSYGPFDAVNAINVVDETGQTGPFNVDLEQIAAWDPEYVFLNPANMAQVNEEYAQNPAFFQALQAVRQGNVYSQPSYIHFGTNYELAIANAYYVGSVIYPDAFKDLDLNKKLDEIFTTILGKPYLETLNSENLGFQKLTIGQ